MACTRRRIRFHCVVCSSECDRRAIQCGDCGRWTHVDRVGFCEDEQDVRGIQFICTGYISGEGQQYDWQKSLEGSYEAVIFLTFHVLLRSN